MTTPDDPTCRYCGRPVSPCANCGATTGEMLEVHGSWIHRRPGDCIMILNRKLSAAVERLAELGVADEVAIP